MVKIIERSLKYLIGGIIGFIIGYSLMMIEMPILELSFQTCQALSVASIIIGVIIAIAFNEHKESKNLKENHDLRNETVALITHEMRTGLTATGWAIQAILKKYPEKIEQTDKEMLENVVSSIHTTIRHSVDLLDISLLDIGKLAIAREWLTLDHIEKLFKDIVTRFKQGANHRGIEFVSDIVLDPKREVEVDIVRLRIILENLLENALQYTVNEKKEITVKIYNTDKNLEIMVSDTGIGIPDTDKEKIFREFYRAPNARSVLHSGSGIGLYTSAQYVRAHGGEIKFESEEGIGTTFFVSIPLKTVADVDSFLEKI